MQLTKMCKCNAPSSGPRIINYQENHNPEGFTIKMRAVKFACDECDTAWADDHEIKTSVNAKEEEMTPYEINLKIAQLQGRTIKNRFGQGIWVTPIKEEYDTSIKNWAENISDAWELFEEMPPGSFIKKMDREPPGFDCLVYLGKSTMYVGGKGDTAPRAISRAWLKWKGAKC